MIERRLLNKRYVYDKKSHYKLNEIQKESKERVELKIDNGVYKWESFSCECGANEDDFVLLAEKDRYGFKLQTVICKKCGLMMSNPRMTQETYNEFYDNEYRKIYGGVASANDAGEEFFERNIKNGRRILRFIESAKVECIKSVLEVGCGMGTNLVPFKEKGYVIKGIDLGGEYVEFGKEHGLDLEKCSSRELIGRDKKYDLIILNHVFEHFLDIEKELRVIKELLSEDGFLYIAVPGILSIGKDYTSDLLNFLQNAHVYHFTMNTLKVVMEKYGWEMVIGDEEVQALFRVNNIVKKDNRNEYALIMRALKKFEIMRPFAKFKYEFWRNLYLCKKKILG